MKIRKLAALFCAGLMLLLPLFATAEEITLQEGTASAESEPSGAEPTESSEPETTDTAWVNEGDTLAGAAEAENVDVWAVEDYELSTMYEDPYVLRRAANTTDAYVVFYLPYLEEAELLSYSWPEHVVSFRMLFSKDGKTWEDKAMTVSEEPDTEGQGRWTKLYHKASGLRGVSYLKIEWPDELSGNDWWNPYLGSIRARLGTPQMEQIRCEVPDKLVIPRYDRAEYPLKASAVDQIENPVAAEITWQSKEAALPEGVTLKEDGTLEVSHDCTAQSITLTVSCSDGNKTLTADVTVMLEAAKIGDVNYDNVIDEKDFEFAYLHYGKTETDVDWQSLRLADVDEDGKIDIADIAYLAYYAEEEESTEKGNEN